MEMKNLIKRSEIFNNFKINLKTSFVRIENQGKKYFNFFKLLILVY